MQILIIGGTRFIGPYVVRRLVDEGHRVALFHRGKTETALPEGVRCIHGDRQDLDQFASEFRSLAPDVVLDMMLFNEDEARALLSVFRGIARRVVALGSSDVYRAYELLRRVSEAPPADAPADEDALLREHLYPHRAEAQSSDERHYNYEKILVERVLMNDAQLPCTVLRLPAVYGPGDYQHRLFPYLKRMDDGRPTILLEEGLDKWRWTRGYVENVADATALAVCREEAAGRIYNVGEASALSEAEWVRAIAQEVGWDGELLVLPADELPPKMRWDMAFQHHCETDTSRIRLELGYAERVPRPEALRRTIEWERAHPPDEINAEEFDYQAEDTVERQGSSRKAARMKGKL
jgi:nucleoside-diphosphate-sugar epimerase